MLFHLLFFSCIDPCGDHIINLADIDHLLPEELSGAHAVLAPVCAQHLVHHLVRLHHAHRAQHLSPVTCDLLKRFPQLEIDDAGGDQALCLHAEAVLPSRFYCHQRLALVPKLSGKVSNAHCLHESLKVVTLGQLELSTHLVSHCCRKSSQQPISCRSESSNKSL